jgi:hypothetical protein
LDDYELNVDDVFGSCLPGTTGGDVEDHSITIGCGYASPNLRASEEMDGIEPSTNQTVDMKAYKDFEPSNACTAPVPASHNPYLPHQNVFSGSSRSIQDTAASTAIGVWAEPLPSTNVHQPGATQGYGRQDERQIGAQLDPTREHSYGYDIARAPSPYAPDNMGSISTLWAEPGVRAHDQYTEHIDPAMTLNYHSDTSPHPPPWNNLDWSIIQDARPVEPVCGCWGTSSRVPAATHSSASTLPWTRTSRSTSDLGGFDLYESEDSVPASLTTGSQQPLWYCEHGNPIKYFRSESDLGYGDAYGASAPSDYLESQYLAAGQDPRLVLSSYDVDFLLTTMIVQHPKPTHASLRSFEHQHYRP